MSTDATVPAPQGTGLTLSKQVVYRDLSVRIFRRPETSIWRIDATKYGGKREPTGTSDEAEAEAYAIAFLKAVSKRRDADPVQAAQRRVADGIALTLGDAFDIYRKRHLSRQKGTYKASLEVTMALAEAILGRGLTVAGLTPDKIREYADGRVAGAYTYVRAVDGAEVAPTRRPKHRTIYAELVELRTILYAAGNEPGPDGNGPLLGFNPLRKIAYPYPLEPRAQWVMDDARTEALLAGLAVIDKSAIPGSLGRAVTVVRGTGRRAGSVLGLRRRDVLLDPALVTERAVRLCTVQDAGAAWPFGAIWWDAEFEKKGLHGISPMSKRVHDAVVEQMALMDDKRPDAFLWSTARHADRPLPVSQLCNKLTEAEEAARGLGYGITPVPWLKNHGWRREYRSARVNLFDDKLVANVVGWELKGTDTAAMNTAYRQYPARAWYLCAEYLPGRDVVLGYAMMGVQVRVEVPSVPELGAGVIESADAHSPPHSAASEYLETRAA